MCTVYTPACNGLLCILHGMMMMGNKSEKKKKRKKTIYTYLCRSSFIAQIKCQFILNCVIDAQHCRIVAAAAVAMVPQIDFSVHSRARLFSL